MSPMLGEGVLPESVNDARRRFRRSVNSVRQPIRQTRQSLIPGPDLIGRAESTALDLRDRVTDREGLLDRINSQQIGNGGSDNSGSNGGNSGSNSPPAT